MDEDGNTHWSITIVKKNRLRDIIIIIDNMEMENSLKLFSVIIIIINSSFTHLLLLVPEQGRGGAEACPS